MTLATNPFDDIQRQNITDQAAANARFLQFRVDMQQHAQAMRDAEHQRRYVEALTNAADKVRAAQIQAHMRAAESQAAEPLVRGKRGARRPFMGGMRITSPDGSTTEVGLLTEISGAALAAAALGIGGFVARQIRKQKGQA
jgi:hypothetical protein